MPWNRLSLSLSLISFNSVRAETTLSVSTPSDPILEVSLSSNLVSLDLTPTINGTDFKTANLTTSVGTNNITGYTLYMNVANSDLTRTQAFNNTTPVIASLAENADGYTEANFTTNSWGYRIGSGNYLAIPSGNFTLSSNFEPTNSESTTITFASKVDMSQPAGTYNTDVDIIAVANPNLILQDIDTWEGSVTSSQAVKAKDSRDGKYYNVSRLPDGKIWLLDNLALDLLDTKVQTNMTPITTNASTTAISSLYNGGRANGDQYATAGVEAALLGSENWNSGSRSYSAARIYMADENVVPSNPPTNSFGYNKVGGRYNLCAASAGSYCFGNAQLVGECQPEEKVVSIRFWPQLYLGMKTRRHLMMRTIIGSAQLFPCHILGHLMKGKLEELGPSIQSGLPLEGATAAITCMIWVTVVQLLKLIVVFFILSVVSLRKTLKLRLMLMVGPVRCRYKTLVKPVGR